MLRGGCRQGQLCSFFSFGTEGLDAVDVVISPDNIVCRVPGGGLRISGVLDSFMVARSGARDVKP